MENKIEIFKLDIDVDAAVKSASDFKVQAEGLKASLDSLKASGDTSSETYVKMKSSYDAVNKEYKTAQSEISKLTSLENTEIKTIEQTRNALSIVTAQWNKQASAYGVNSKEVQELAAKKLELTNRLKTEEMATGDASRGVAQYTAGIKQAVGEVSIFGVSINSVTQYTDKFSGVIDSGKKALLGYYTQIVTASKGTEGLSVIQKTSAISSNILSGALGILKIALISTGVGAIVVAFGALITYLTTTQAGMDKLTSLTRPLQAIFQSLIGVAQNLGQRLSEAASSPQKAFRFLVDFITGQVLNRFKAVLMGLEAIKNGDFDALTNSIAQFTTGVEDAGKKTSEFFGTAIKKGTEVDKLTKGIEQKQLEYNRQIEKTNDLIDVQKLKQKDSSLSMEQRKKATEEIIKLSKDLGDQEASIVKDKIKVLSIEQSYNDTSREGQQEMIDLESKLNAAQDRGINAQIEGSKFLSGAKKEAHAANLARIKEATDASIKGLENEVNAFKASQGFRKKSDDDIIENAKTLNEKLKAVALQKLEADKISQIEYNTEIATINNDYAKTTADIAISNAQREYDTKIQQLERQNEVIGIYDQAQRDKQLENARLQFEEEEILEKAKLDNGLINQRDYDDAIIQATYVLNDRKKEAQLLFEATEKERLAIDNENQAIIDDAKIEDEIIKKQAKLDAERAQEISSAEATGASIKLINEKYDSYDKQLMLDKETRDKAVFDSKLEGHKANFNATVALFGKESAAGKAASLAMAAINVYEGITKAIAQGGILGIATGAIVSIAGLAAVKNIMSTKTPTSPKAEKGALFKIGGKRHSGGGTKFSGEDGTQFEAEKGELIGVMNRNASQAFMDFNDSYPSSAGLRSGASGGMLNRMGGGNVNNVSGSIIDYDVLATKIADANRYLPAPVVAITDINEGQLKLTKITNGSII